MTLRLLLLLMLCSWPATLAAESPQDLAARVQAAYDRLDSLAVSFEQSSLGPLSDNRLGSGRALFLRGSMQGSAAKMRWDYVTPEQQVLISDGTTLSMYFAQLNQLLVSPATVLEQDLTYNFFSGRTTLAQAFQIQAGPVAEEGATLRLQPRTEQSQLKELLLWIGPNDLIQELELVDHFDTRTRMRFSAISPNALNGVAAAELEQLFSFTPPPGTEIIRQ